MKKTLSEQAKELIGKNWTNGALTREKNLGNVERLMERIQERTGLDNIQFIKPGHLETAIRELQAEGRSSSTITGYMTAARMVAAGVGKPNIVPRNNSAWGVSRAGERLRPITPDRGGQEQVRTALAERGEHLVLAHDLRSAFGLRAKESLLSHRTEDRGGKSFLIVEGAKGGRGREIEVKTEAQRELLARVQDHIKLTGGNSLCPPDKTLKQAYDQQRNALRAVGANRQEKTHAHAQRHGWAQDEKRDGATRADLAEDLGHGRADVVSHYIPK